uniref:Ig-like domain-containing protein n=1 Tax=Romanomermis culicivorax TaxID=13658 RepID=A0A915HPV6_ROMCU
MKLLIVVIFLCKINAEMHSDFTVMSPRFRSYIRSQQEVIVGDVLKLNCAAVGKPPPYVHWYRNGKLMVPVSGLALSRDLQSAVFDANNQLGFSNEQSGNERIKISRFLLRINKVK